MAEQARTPNISAAVIWQRIRSLGRQCLSERYLIVTLLLVLPALLPLAAPGYFFDAHDAHHSVFFLVEFDQAIQDGVLWPVWGPDHALGFGYPTWLLYAPAAYFVAEGFHLLGLGFTAAVKATWALAFLLGALGTYRLARRWWGPAAGMVAALAFTYAPYHLGQIFVRAALAEFVALAWLPWVLLFFDRLWENPRPRPAALAALAFGGLLLTHTVSTLIFVPLLGGFLVLKALIGLWQWRRWAASGDRGKSKGAGLKPVVWSLGALALGLLLAMIFLLPMLLERGFVAQEQWTAATYSYGLHFVYPGQFLAPGWGFGYSTPGLADGMSFQLGLLPLLGAIAGGLVLFASRRAAGSQPLPRRPEVAFFLLISLGALFAMTPAAKPIWDNLPLVELIQFPWRLLVLTTMTLALLSGAAIGWLRSVSSSVMSLQAPVFGAQQSFSNRGDCFVIQDTPGNDAANVVAWVFALAIVIAGFPYTRPELLPIRPEDESSLAVIEFETAHSDMRGKTRWAERMPANEDSPLLADYLAGAPLQRAAIVAGSGSVTQQQSAGASAEAVVQAETEVRLRFYWYYFPGWRVTVDGLPVEISPDPPNGLIGLTLPPGRHDVRLRFGSTPPRRMGVGISVVALAAVLGLWVGGRHREGAAPHPS